MILCALYDRATEAYAPIMTVHTRGEAIRAFDKNAKNKESPLNKNPTDFELFVLGNYDNQTGTITPANERIARAEDHVS